MMFWIFSYLLLGFVVLGTPLGYDFERKNKMFKDFLPALIVLFWPLFVCWAGINFFTVQNASAEDKNGDGNV